MIETKKQYQDIIGFWRKEQYDHYPTIDLIATIEALRDVARAAEGALNYDMARAIWVLDDDEAQDMQDALDKIPAWLTEDD